MSIPIEERKARFHDHVIAEQAREAADIATIQEYFQRAGVELTEAQAVEILRLNSAYTALGMPGFAEALQGLLGRPPLT